MPEQVWSDVDAYIAERLIPADPVMDAVLAANRAAGLPAIDVSPAQGRFLELLVRMTGARTILEIGTLGGYSTIWMARALPEGGRIVTLEYTDKHAAVARANVERAGVSDRIVIRVGAALDSLPGVAADAIGPFDLVFIDADKPNNPHYLDWAVRLAHPGTVIVVDNVVRNGGVIRRDGADANIGGARAAFDRVRVDPRLVATALQTVGAKGYDGFIIARVE